MKKFTVGQRVEIQRRVSYSPWEGATYLDNTPFSRGWHRVRLNKNSPPRRINTMSGEETGLDDPQGVLTDILFVPSRRIRAKGKKP